jgi:multidrug efflux pump subunit AcrA (membrane-fusion protein)
MQAIIQAWLDKQCGQINSATGAVVLLLPRNGNAPVPVAQWPREARPGPDLLAAAQSSYDGQRAMTHPRMNGAERPIPLGPMMSCPVQIQGRLVGAVAVGFAPQVGTPAPDVVAGLKRAADDFETFLRQGGAPAKPAAAMPAAPAAPARYAPNDVTRTQPDAAASGRAQLGPLPVAPPPPAMPADAIAMRPSIPTLREPVDRTVELAPANSARILNLLATLDAHETFTEAAIAFVTELATAFSCSRVSVGLSGRRHVKVEALSHSAEVVESQGLLRALGAAMEEAIWQGATLVYPLPEGAQPRVDRAHADLAQRHGCAWVTTIPLVKSGKPFGAITLERTRAEPLTRSELTLCENIGALLGPLLELKRTVSKPWHAKIAAGVREGCAPLFGPGHLAVKAIVVALVVAVTAGALIQCDYRVSSRARLEGSVQRLLAAPADGYLKLAYARPGDVVKAGQLLAELADDDLKLEERKAQSEVAQLENSYGTALVKQDRAEVAIIFAKLEESRAQLALAQSRLTRTQLRAPFDGIVITGDLTQSLGAPVKKGEALMTVAPEHDYRVIVEVDERDIGDVRLHQNGSLALSAMPGDTFPIEVARITPVATSGDGRNFFEVEARLKDNAGRDLRPGLIGVAKVEAGSRSWLWICTHRVTDWIRLTLWSWVG